MKRFIGSIHCYEPRTSKEAVTLSCFLKIVVLLLAHTAFYMQQQA